MTHIQQWTKHIKRRQIQQAKLLCNLHTFKYSIKLNREDGGGGWLKGKKIKQFFFIVSSKNLQAKVVDQFSNATKKKKRQDAFTNP